MSLIRALAVVVPVRNEEELLPGCLASIDVAARRVDAPVHVVVVLDRCTDGSARIAQAWPGVVCVATDAGCVGTARELGVRRALQDVGTCADEAWLAGTDADSQVPPDWLRRQVALAAQGVGLVLGTVRLREAGDRVAATWQRRYRRRITSDGTHPHVHGANLGVRAATYLRVGGWPPLPAHEDRELVARVRGGGATVVATDAVEVTTSGRRGGRARHGVAGDLRAVALELAGNAELPTDDDAAA